jgi:hypothetical protein
VRVPETLAAGKATLRVELKSKAKSAAPTDLEVILRR